MPSPTPLLVKEEADIFEWKITTKFYEELTWFIKLNDNINHNLFLNFLISLITHLLKQLPDSTPHSSRRFVWTCLLIWASLRWFIRLILFQYLIIVAIIICSVAISKWITWWFWLNWLSILQCPPPMLCNSLALFGLQQCQRLLDNGMVIKRDLIDP